MRLSYLTSVAVTSSAAKMRIAGGACRGPVKVQQSSALCAGPFAALVRDRAKAGRSRPHRAAAVLVRDLKEPDEG